MSKSILKNLSYNIILQIVLMILPLVSIPYVSRILGAEGIGTYSFTLSLTQYFIILGTLGTGLYGNRQVAYVRDNKDELSKTFWSIFTIRFIAIILAVIAYFAMFINAKEYFTIRMLQSIHIFAAIFDVTWLFIGLEDFKRIVTRNLLVKMLGLVAIFMFVKTSEDVFLYTFINVLMSVGSSLIMWLYVPHIVNFKSIKHIDLKAHFIPILGLFIPQLASQVYVLLDKTMLGYLATVEEVGYYTQAERIVKSVLELISALGLVMLPRMSNIYAKGDLKKMEEYLNTSLIGISYVAIPMMFGIMAVAYGFVPWFYGPGYEKVHWIMFMLSPILVFVTYGSVFGVQYLLPTNQIKAFTISIVAGALVNLVLNFILIPRYQSLGAAFATISAEGMVALSQAYMLRHVIDFKRYFGSLYKYLISAILMFAVAYGVGLLTPVGVLSTVYQVGAGMILYFGTLILMREPMNQRAIELISSIIMRRMKGRNQK